MDKELEKKLKDLETKLKTNNPNLVYPEELIKHIEQQQLQEQEEYRTKGRSQRGKSFKPSRTIPVGLGRGFKPNLGPDKDISLKEEHVKDKSVLINSPQDLESSSSLSSISVKSATQVKIVKGNAKFST